MDLKTDNATIHLPQEIVNHICSFLDQVSDIQATRLASRALDQAAKPLLLDLVCRPAELLRVQGTLDVVARRARPVNEEGLLTTWTWLRIPASIPVEDEETEAGAQFQELVAAPDTVGSYRGSARNGRTATCWGRIREDPEVLCLMHQWTNLATWTDYLSSPDAERLRGFLNPITKTSWSEYTRLPRWLSRKAPLFQGYCEIRSIYFNTAMTSEQRARFDNTKHLNSHLPYTQGCMYISSWCWLRGLRFLPNKQLLGAARFVFSWTSEEIEKSWQDHEKRPSPEHGGDMIRVADLFKTDLDAAGYKDIESVHCDFIRGTWRN